MSAKARLGLRLALLVGATLLATVVCAPSSRESGDSDVAASGHEHLGRVQIKVYRGPTEHDGHRHFAPWGFWVKQPADDGHRHR